MQGGGTVSTRTVKDLVGTVVQEWSHRGMELKDDHIVQLLRAKGVVVARRTVAKYRATLGIPGARTRRQAAQSGGDLPPEDLPSSRD